LQSELAILAQEALLGSVWSHKYLFQSIWHTPVTVTRWTSSTLRHRQPVTVTEQIFWHSSIEIAILDAFGAQLGQQKAVRAKIHKGQFLTQDWALWHVTCQIDWNGTVTSSKSLVGSHGLCPCRGRSVRLMSQSCRQMFASIQLWLRGGISNVGLGGEGVTPWFKTKASCN
jgi:hypothetical protein